MIVVALVLAYQISSQRSLISIQNHIVERIWVEVNVRVNYPIKETLIRMLDQGDISTDDQQCRFCISWFTLRVANIGLNLLVSSWNEHPIPSKYMTWLCDFLASKDAI